MAERRFLIAKHLGASFRRTASPQQGDPAHATAYRRALHPMVQKGDHVYLGQVVGDSDAYVSAPIHASVSGTVAEITSVMLTGGQMTAAVVIDSDGKMERDPNIYPPAAIRDREELAQAARSAGLVGLGGAGFPAHVKLNVPKEKTIDTLIVNAAECEPYVTADHREALENGKTSWTAFTRSRRFWTCTGCWLLWRTTSPT